MHVEFRVVTDLFRRIVLLVAALALLAGCTTQTVMESAVAPLAGDKYAALVIDARSGRVLYESHSQEPRYPASLTKMMTLYLLFEAIDSGRVGIDDQIPVSAYARGRPPSKIGFKAGQSIDVRSAILALCVKSANDVASAVAEHLGGSEERFAAMMTSKAHQLGMRSTTFRNASGLPDSAQSTTARDMAVLAVALRRNFPHHYHNFRNTEFAYAGKVVRGHNELLGRPGVDGLKTGYTRASGFNLATSASHGGKRIVAVVLGGESAASRNAHMNQLIDTYLPRAGSGS